MTMRSAALAAFAVFFAGAAAAQSFAGLSVGDDAAKAKALGLPSDTERQKGYALSRWRLADGNDLSLAAEPDGQIAFMETNWGGTPEGRAAGLFGFTFGTTSLAAIRKKLGSNGMSFRSRAPVMNTTQGLVMMNSYEVGAVVATFICLIAPADLGKAKSGDLSDHARLVAISLASPAYAGATWGQPATDPSYKRLPAP
jgi:hypothetical protein